MAARVAVLASGSGSNLQALIDHHRPLGLAEIGLVIVNRPEAYAAERARRAGIEAVLIDHQSFADRSAFESALDRQLRAYQPNWICLAGFMRVLTDPFVNAWTDRLINIHPSLLPAFRGLHTHRRALEIGVRVHGCTVHLVRPELDAGPIIAQAATAVFDDDDEEKLAARVLRLEHRIYPMALEALVTGRAEVADGRVRWRTAADAPPGLIWPMAAPGTD